MNGLGFCWQNQADLYGTYIFCGINQDVFASFCQISKSNLALIETNRRDWPYKVYPTHDKFRKAVEEVQKRPLPESPVFDSLVLDQKEDAYIQLLKWGLEYNRLKDALDNEKFRFESAFRLQ